MLSLDISQFRRSVGQVIFGCLEDSDLLFGINMGHHFGFSVLLFFRHFPHSGRHFYKGGTDEALGH